MKVSEFTETEFIHNSLILELMVVKAPYGGLEFAYLFLYLLFLYFIYSSLNGDGTCFQITFLLLDSSFLMCYQECIIHNAWDLPYTYIPFCNNSSHFIELESLSPISACDSQVTGLGSISTLS